MRRSEQTLFTIGTKFTSTTFTDAAEVVAIREDLNEVDVMLTTSENHSRVEKKWNLEHVRSAFARGEYKPKEKETFTIGVW
jgi:hypothetical protein